jgi:hypothetical protein
MSNYLKGLALIGVGMLLLALAQLGLGQAWAQDTTAEVAPNQVGAEEGMTGWGGIMNRAMMVRNMGARHQGAGNRHEARGMMQVDAEEMHAAIAEALGISVAELEAARAEGQSVYALAEERDVDLAQVTAAMQAAHAEALARAVADGLITQEQAQTMLAHRAQMGAEHGGGMMGAQHMRGTMGLGFGQGFGGHHGECPFAGPAE